jgi:hypothetical protein
MRQLRMSVAMWCLAVTVPLAGIAVVAIPLVGLAAPGGGPFTATATEPTAGDLAKALKVDWWCYHLHFSRQIKGIRVILCEARRSQTARGHKRIILRVSSTTPSNSKRSTSRFSSRILHDVRHSPSGWVNHS